MGGHCYNDLMLVKISELLIIYHQLMVIFPTVTVHREVKSNKKHMEAGEVTVKNPVNVMKVHSTPNKLKNIL